MQESGHFCMHKEASCAREPRARNVLIGSEEYVCRDGRLRMTFQSLGIAREAFLVFHHQHLLTPPKYIASLSTVGDLQELGPESLPLSTKGCSTRRGTQLADRSQRRAGFGTFCVQPNIFLIGRKRGRRLLAPCSTTSFVV